MKDSVWGSFSEESTQDFYEKCASPVDYMVVAPALRAKAAFNPNSFMMDEEEMDEEEEYEDEMYEDEEEGETNARMAMGQLRSMAEDVMMILSELSEDDELEPWVAAKITMSKQNLSAVADYLRFGDDY